MARSPEQERNVELAREGLDVWMSGDVESTLKRLTEDVEVFVPPELGNAGSYRGHEEFLQWTSAWDEAWSEFSYEILESLPVGERHVVAMVRTAGTGRGSGIQVENVLAWVFGVRDGLCEYVSLWPSREEAVALAERREREA